MGKWKERIDKLVEAGISFREHWLSRKRDDWWSRRYLEIEHQLHQWDKAETREEHAQKSLERIKRRAAELEEAQPEQEEAVLPDEPPRP